MLGEKLRSYQDIVNGFKGYVCMPVKNSEFV